jgi:type VI protein secretion system component Hcp
MKSAHSWKWLAPRLIRRHLRNSPGRKGAVGRPFLALERLEDRNLLSASGAPAGLAPPPSGDAQIVANLLQGELTVTQDEFQLLNALAGASPVESKVKIHEIPITQVIDKASPLLVQLQDQLLKIAIDGIDGEAQDAKHKGELQAESKIEYLKIKLTDVLISSLDQQMQETVTPILNTLFTDATNLVQGLLSVEGAGGGSQAQKLDYIKLSTDVLKVDILALKGELDVIKVGSTRADLQNIQNKIDSLILKANATIMDLGETASSTLLPAVQDFQNGITRLLGSLGDGGNFPGGVTLPQTDDVIT